MKFLGYDINRKEMVHGLIEPIILDAFLVYTNLKCIVREHGIIYVNKENEIVMVTEIDCHKELIRILIHKRYLGKLNYYLDLYRCAKVNCLNPEDLNAYYMDSVKFCRTY